MALLDDRGRLFGKVNLIDAAVVLFVLGLIPLGYVSWQMFRTPPATVTATPFTTRPFTEGRRYDLKGEHLRPFLRVFIGDAPARFLFETPTHAEVLVPALPPGRYDLRLFDDTHEIARLPGAVVVVADTPPTVSSVSPTMLEFTKEPQHVTVVGEHLPAAAKAQVGTADAGYQRVSDTKADVILPALPPGSYDITLADGPVELVRVPKAVTVPKPTLARVSPAVVDAQREPQRVEFFGKHLQPGIRMFVGWKEIGPQFLSLEKGEFQLPTFPAGQYDVVLFDPSATVEYARLRKAITVQEPVTIDVTVRARFLVRPEVLAVVKSTPPAPPNSPAVLVTYKEELSLTGTTKTDLKEGTLVVVEATIRLQATKRSDGVVFDGQALRAGAPLILRMPTYQLNGDLLTVEMGKVSGR